MKPPESIPLYMKKETQRHVKVTWLVSVKPKLEYRTPHSWNFRLSPALRCIIQFIIMSLSVVLGSLGDRGPCIFPGTHVGDEVLLVV